MSYPVLELSFSKPVRRLKLAEFPTRRLKHMLDIARSNYYRHYLTNGTSYTFDELKAELDIREHIPNKTEARTIRQKEAKAKRNRR